MTTIARRPHFGPQLRRRYDVRECNPRQRLHEWVPRRPLVQQQPQNCPPRGNVEYYEVKPHFRSRHGNSPQRAVVSRSANHISLLALVGAPLSTVRPAESRPASAFFEKADEIC